MVLRRWESETWKFGFIKRVDEGRIGHFGKYHHTLCLSRPKFCISIVFVFSWDHCKSQEKLETMLMQNDKEYYGIFWSGLLPPWEIWGVFDWPTSPLSLVGHFRVRGEYRLCLCIVFARPASHWMRGSTGKIFCLDIEWYGPIPE